MRDSVCPTGVRQVESRRHWQIIVPCHFPPGENKAKKSGSKFASFTHLLGRRSLDNSSIKQRPAFLD